MSETRTVTLGEVFTPEQLTKIEDYIKEMAKKKVQPMDPKFTKGLKEMFTPWKEELAAKGFDSDYMAYLITYLYSK